MQVKIEGILGIQRAEELKELIASACRNDELLEIVHGNVSEIDITYLQLLTAIGKTCQSAGRQLRLYADPEGCLLNAIQKSGFLNIKLIAVGA